MKRTIFIVILLLSLVTMVFAKSKEIIVKVKDVSTVSDEVVKLKDIALVVGDERLNNIKILKFSNSANSFLISKQLILNQIALFYQKHNEPIPEIKIFSKSGIRINKKMYVISDKTLRQIVVSFLNSNKEKIFNGKKFHIEKIICPPSLKLPTDKIDIKVTLTENNNFSKLPLIVEIFNVKHKKLKTLKVFAIVTIEERVVIAKRNIPIRRIILPQDVELRKVAVKNSHISYYSSLKDVIGKISKRFIRKGEAISDEIVQTPPMVKRGEIVTVVAKSNGIVITTKGKALDNGFYNNSVRILNMKSGKVFSGTVMGYGKVVVTF